MNEQQRHYLGVMGIQVWEQRAPDREEGSRLKVEGSRTGEVEPPPAESEPAALAPEHPIEMVSEDIQMAEQVPADLEPSTSNLEPVVSLDWPELRERVAGCTACDELVANRSQTVFGVGNQSADWLVIGEAPGADEDRLGEPFVGRAGQLLNAMLAAIGLQRQQVYIANVLKCRPPNNRDPRPEEAEACSAFLERQIALLQPKIILVVGRIAAQNLLRTDVPIGKLRGRLHRLDNGIPVVVTYHPAYLLRSPQEKRKAWADLCLARNTVQEREG
jgi:uracil-DNA glycosylase family 4